MDLGALQGDDFARSDLGDVAAAERCQGAGFAGDGPAAVRQAADGQRPEPPRVTDGQHTIAAQQDQRERPLPGRQGAFDAVLPRLPAGGGEHQRHHLGVARRRQAEPPRQQFLAQVRRVDDVAVVSQGQRPVHRLDDERLDVAVGVATGRRVAGVPDGVVADQWRQRLTGEHVGDEARLLVHPNAPAVADRQPGGLLAAVLQGEQSEER